MGQVVPVVVEQSGYSTVLVKKDSLDFHGDMPDLWSGMYLRPTGYF